MFWQKLIFDFIKQNKTYIISYFIIIIILFPTESILLPKLYSSIFKSIETTNVTPLLDNIFKNIYNSTSSGLIWKIIFIWILIILLSILMNSLLVIFLLLIPKFFATINAVWGLTQHMGLKENTKDHRLSTRSVRLNPIFSFIYWKMEYHIEHHMFPMVPSYNLPKLHEIIKKELPKPQNLFEAYKEIIPAVIKKHKDPNYFISVKIPSNQ